MNKTLSRVLWIIAGVLLIVAGVYCFVSPDAALSGLSLILGLAMLFSGIVDIVIFASSRRFMLGSGWFTGWHLHCTVSHFPALQPGIHHAFAAVYFRDVATLRRYQPFR